MMHQVLGPQAYRKGIDIYFERHDGQAVTCDDFISALDDASDADIRQFEIWYRQAGTPELAARREGKTDSHSASHLYLTPTSLILCQFL